MDFINGWANELEIIHNTLQKLPLDTTTKWGNTVYTYKNKNVVSCAGFKNFISIWFYDGVFLKDPKKILINASEGKTKALRQWRIADFKTFNEKTLIAYVKEAITNLDKGLTLKPAKSEKAKAVGLLKKELEKNAKLQKAFNTMTSFKQKEFIEFVESAKKEETKLSRLEKIKPMILNRIGLNDKYRPK